MILQCNCAENNVNVSTVRESGDVTSITVFLNCCGRTRFSDFKDGLRIEDVKQWSETLSEARFSSSIEVFVGDNGLKTGKFSEIGEPPSGVVCFIDPKLI